MKIKDDPFLSEILGFSCGLITDWSRPWEFGHYAFLSFKTSQFKELEKAISVGFQYITTNVVLRRPELNEAPPVSKDLFSVERLKKSDIPAVVRLGRECFTLDRFHLDKRLSKEQANGIYERWTENDCKGRAERVWVARKNGTPIGFIALRRRAIDLLAVDRQFANQGVGTAMLWEALKRCPVRGAETQIYNPVVAFYQKRGGFVPSKIVHVLHRWRETL